VYLYAIMARTTVEVADTLLKDFKQAVGKRKGARRGALQEAMEEALKLWILQASEEDTGGE
jgi:hypothetical protein